MSSILHISYDLRGRNNNEVTSAVRNLINESSKYLDTLTIDLLRVPRFKEEMIVREKFNYIKFNVFGFRRGIFLIRHLNRAYKKIKRTLINENLNLDDVKNVFAHKLTFEGYIANKIAREKKIPLFVTIRGTDLVVQKYRPDLLPIYQSVLIYASKIFILQPAIKNKLLKLYGERFYKQHIKNKITFLPNIIDKPKEIFIGEVDEKQFLLVSRMQRKTVINKNLKRLLKAFSLLKEKNYILNIIGGGDYTYKVEEWIKKFHLNERVKLLGSVDHSKINEYYSKSFAYLMPSISESFGMAYIESLLNGTPILYPKGSWEGYFGEVGSVANPFDINSIKEAIEDIIENNNQYRTNIQELLRTDAFNIFDADYIDKLLEEILIQEKSEVPYLQP